MLGHSVETCYLTCYDVNSLLEDSNFTLFTLLFQQFPLHAVVSSVWSFGNNFRTYFWSNLWTSPVLNGKPKCKDHSIFWGLRTSLINWPLASPCPTRTFSLQIQFRLWSNRGRWRSASQTTRNRRWFFWRSRGIWNIDENYEPS